MIDVTILRSYPLKFCQCCGKPIVSGQKVVKIEYGAFGYSAHPHPRIQQQEGKPDWFHRACDVAIRGD